LIKRKAIVRTIWHENLRPYRLSKPRDLFDVNKMKECQSNLDANLLKKTIIFYMSLDGLFKVDETTLDKIKLIDKEDIKKELCQSCLKAVNSIWKKPKKK